MTMSPQSRDRRVAAVIIAILTVLIFICYAQCLQRVKKESCRYKRQSVLQAMDLYELNSAIPCGKDYKRIIQTLVKEGYIGEVPGCPEGGRYYLGKDTEGRTKIKCTEHR